MSNIFVPLDYSELKSVLPPSEDIIYSTLAKYIFNLNTGSLKMKEIFTSHVLLTPRHLAYTKPVKNKEPELKLIPLHDVLVFRAKPAGQIVLGIQFLELIRDPNFETEDNFQTRLKRFGPEFIPYLLEAKKERLQEMEANPEEFDKKRINSLSKHIGKIEKSFEKFKKKSGN